MIACRCRAFVANYTHPRPLSDDHEAIIAEPAMWKDVIWGFLAVGEDLQV